MLLQRGDASSSLARRARTAVLAAPVQHALAAARPTARAEHDHAPGRLAARDGIEKPLPDLLVAEHLVDRQPRARELELESSDALLGERDLHNVDLGAAHAAATVCHTDGSLSTAQNAIAERSALAPKNGTKLEATAASIMTP